MDSNEVQRLYTKKASLYHFLFVDFLGGGRKVENFLRESDSVRSRCKILDAGCGTGNATRALYTISREKGYENVTFHAFDLTQAMLDMFRQWIEKMGIKNITLRQANVLHLEELPLDWNDYDLIVSSAMLEYLQKGEIRRALSGLKRLLKHDGKLIVFITKRNFFTKVFIEWWWKANVYNEKELEQIFMGAGFAQFKIMKFWWYSMFVIEAKKK